jgi:hypothetical protein
MGTRLAATTTPIRAGDPVVTSTNQGSASRVICEPVVEIASAASSAASGRRRSRTPRVVAISR